MPWTIACTTCGKQLRLPETLVGQTVRCPSCKNDLVVTETAGRISVGSTRPKTAPDAAPSTRSPASAARPPVGASRPFVFRVSVVHDPAKRIGGELRARVDPGGLELRDRRGHLYDLPVGTAAHHLGGNRLSVDIASRMVVLRIDQLSCEQAALAADLAAFLTGKRGELRFADYRPRRLVRLLALAPLLVPVALIPFHVGGRLGVWVWTALGLVTAALSLLLLRTEALALRQRLRWIGAFWAIGLLSLIAVMPDLHRAGMSLDSTAATWAIVASADGKWTADMPGQARERKPQTGDPLGASGSITEVDFPLHGIQFAVRALDLHPLDFDRLLPAAHFNVARDAFGRAHTLTNADTEVERILSALYPGRDFWFTKNGARRAMMRVYVVRPRIYVLTVLATEGLRAEDATRFAEHAGRFFDSFRLMPAGQAEPAEIVGKDEATPISPDLRAGQPAWLPAPPQLPAQPKSPLEIAGGGLMGYWKFDEGQGSLVRDASGFGQHGTLHGGTWIKGVSGRAVMFDGRGDFLDFGDARALNVPAGSGWAVSLWIATRAESGVVLSQRNSLGPGPMFDVLIEHGFLEVQTRQDGLAVAPSVVASGVRVGDGDWHHIAVVRDPFGTVGIFVDGIARNQVQTNWQNARGPITTHWRTLGSERWWVRWDKQRDGRSYFNGCVDEFCIFNRELQAEEIRLLSGRK